MPDGILRQSSNRVEDLAHEAAELLAIVRQQARRAYVVEISGTPKAGKTSTIAMLRGFFRACGWRVEVLSETAAACPLPMKGHFFFNTWTTATMLSGLLAAVDRALDLIIVDRGLFDAVVWLELQRRRGQVSDEESRAFRDFVLLERWRELVDASLIMQVAPQTAMAREQNDRLIERTGTVMNVDSLTEFNSALGQCRHELRDSFEFLGFDVDEVDRKEAATQIARSLLRSISSAVDPLVAGVPAPEMDRLSAIHGTCLPWSEWGELSKHVSVRRRSEAEQDGNWVQFMACGVLRFRDGVFVFDRTDDAKVSRYGKSTLWRSQHVEASDSVQAANANWVAERLLSRLAETLYVQVGFGGPVPLGIVWDKGAEAQHAALIYSVSVDNENVAETLIEKEFKTSGRRNTMVSRFVPLVEVEKGVLQLEPWSRAIVHQGWL